ncbi:MAG: valine--tRNA ligase [Candidatus Paceibacterota bacterium]
MTTNPDFKEPNIDPKFLSPYNPQETESRIFSLWEKSGLFNPDVCIEKGVTKADAPKFSIVLPPPNVTGKLHMGHAMMTAVEDLIVRYKRMQGFKTLWVPGTDHAAIATQSKVEKEISKKEGKSRYDLGREELLKRIGEFAKDSHDTIVSQVKAMGASLDWSREAFTLDEKRNLAVRTVFKKMYDEGLIYRGHRIVNWDPKGQTTISDDEIVYVEEKAKLYYFKYGPFVIGTARPETKFGDKYVIMHPEDKRYAEYENGQKLTLEWINGPIEATIIKDPSIDMEFGTGVMTITPWHSVVDFELAQKYGLDKEQVIDKYGKLLPIAGEFAGQKIKDAREKIVEKLQSKGLVDKIEDYTHNIATAERTGGIIEPQIMEQWFVAVNKEFTLPHSEIEGIPSGSKTTLKEIMKTVVENGQIKIIPDYNNKTYFHWIENLRDWCISRQIWYGHRVPVWYKGDEIYNGIEEPSGEGWKQDEDTLDTWFSSGIWTFSTLGWPEKTKDFETFHPTDLLETGYDILFFWVARMILMTGFTLGTIPFKTVYLHGLVRDASGRKMSKSLGNEMDPLDIAAKFGADAARMALVVGTAPGTDMKISEDKIKGYKNFANKLWNITRFVLSTIDGITILKGFDSYTAHDKELIAERDVLITQMTEEIDAYSFHMSAEKIYHYAWHRFADVILEESKEIFKSGSEEEKASRAHLLSTTLETILKLLHPFMPFVTEEIWQTWKKDSILMTEPWPLVK